MLHDLSTGRRGPCNEGMAALTRSRLPPLGMLNSNQMGYSDWVHTGFISYAARV